MQVSALFDAERAVGGALKKGDLVAVYMSFEPFDVEVAGPQTPSGTDDAAIQAAAAAEAGQPSEPAPSDAESTGPTKTPNVTRLEFQKVLVTNVQTTSTPVTSSGDDAADDQAIAQVTGTQYVVTLALSPEQSERFVFASEFGEIWLSIQPATVDDDGTRVVTLGNVYTAVR